MLNEAPGSFDEITALCKICGVNERTLQYTFQEKLGVLPKVYLDALRLHNIRSKLLRVDSCEHFVQLSAAK